MPVTRFDRAAFALATLGAAWLAWSSWRQHYAHGFARVFAFEAITALALRARGRWWHDPLGPRQLASWAMLWTSLGLAVHGFCLLRVLGRPRGQFETTTVLVRDGAYRFIRHPLYASLLWLAWGTFLKAPSRAAAALAAIATGAVYATARTEERELALKFGEAYAEYRRETRMFVPFIL